MRRAPLPELKTVINGKVMQLEWVTPDKLPFPMPVELLVDGKPVRVPMPNGKGTVTFTGTEPTVDPNGWVLRK